MGLQTGSKYTRVLNAKCVGGFGRCRWVKLGRGSMCQTMVAIDEYGRAFTWGQQYAGAQGHGDPDFLGGGVYTYPDLVDIEFATQLLPNNGPFVKSDAGEYSGILMNANGKLYGMGENLIPGDNACFALGAPGVPDQYFTPIRVAPGWTFKDFSFDFYHGHGVTQNNRLVSWGYNIDFNMGNGLPECRWPAYADGRVYTPYENPLMIEDVKLVACEYSGDACVTVDNKVYGWNVGLAWGSMASQVPVEYTGLPSGVDVIEIFAHAYGIIVLLENGEVWAIGQWGIMGDGGSVYAGVFQRVDSIAAKGFCTNIHSSGNALTVHCNMDDGNTWGYGDGYYIHGNHLPDLGYTPQLVGSEFENERFLTDSMINTYQLNGAAIDRDGYLWTWGQQSWGPMLAIGLNYDQVKINPYMTLAAPPKEYYEAPVDPEVDKWSAGIGPSMSHNTVPTGDSEYVQPLPQTEDHNPCGHWHVRLFEQIDEWPKNCWMPSVCLKDGNILFVACGRWLYMFADTGNQVIMMLYNISSNTWQTIMYEEPYMAAIEPGGCDFSGNIYGFANYKADVTGTTYNELYSNYGMGVWIVDSGTVRLTTFADSIEMSAQNKFGCYSSGLAAVAYENGSSQLIVKVTVDSGATWNTRRTIAADPDRKDFSLVVDDNGWIYLAHQYSANYVKIERTIDAGLNWTVQDNSQYLVSGLYQVKHIWEDDKLFLLGRGTTEMYYRYSTNFGASHSSISSLTGGAIVAEAGYEGSRRYIAAIGPSGMHNYRYKDDYAYQWDVVDTPIPVFSRDASMSGDKGLLVYSAYGFFSEPDPAVSLLISMDYGEHWFLRKTPLKYYHDWNEITDGDCNPLFLPAPPGHIEHTWNFVRSDWAETFIKQGNKW